LLYTENLLNVIYLAGFETGVSKNTLTKGDFSMCKNLFVAGVKPEIAKKALWDFLMAATPYMSEYDKDGVGYAAQSSTFGLWGERWRYPESAWRFRPSEEASKSLISRFKGALGDELIYNEFGTFDPEGTHAVILHARMATCGKTMANVHPFIRDNTALIHNGVISNTEELKQITSTCDSECILNSYVDREVSVDPENIQKVADDLRGYYACGVLTKDKDGRQILDVFRGSSASLWACEVKELDCVVFCTKKEIVEAACKDLGWTVTCAFSLKDEQLIRLDAVTGEVLSVTKFKEGSRWNYNAGYGNYGGKVNWGAEKKKSSESASDDPISKQDIDDLYERALARRGIH
jgi:hypothetical protein